MCRAAKFPFNTSLINGETSWTVRRRCSLICGILSPLLRNHVCYSASADMDIFEGGGSRSDKEEKEIWFRLWGVLLWAKCHFESVIDVSTQSLRYGSALSCRTGRTHGRDDSIIGSQVTSALPGKMSGDASAIMSHGSRDLEIGSVPLHATSVKMISYDQWCSHALYKVG